MPFQAHTHQQPAHDSSPPRGPVTIGRRTAVLGALGATAITGHGATTARPASAASAPPPQTHIGEIAGAAYKVVVPHDWNGTLVQFSHGYYPAGFDVTPDWMQLANRAETEQWLLGKGVALAASAFQNKGTGYLVKEGIADQIALLDWFEVNIGRPRRTIAYGQSLGTVIAVQSAERYPNRYDGVASVSGGFDALGLFNTILDMNFAVKALLTNGIDADGHPIDLVLHRRPEQSRDALSAGVVAARTSPQGLARIALAASLNNLTGWYNAHEPQPSTDAAWILGQSKWLHDAYVYTLGATGRADLEAHAGGNPSWNVEVDYARQVRQSAEYPRVRRAYAAAGLDLRADLATLARAPRISADPNAVAYLKRYGVPEGTTPSPVATIHTTGDGGAGPDYERWFADRVRREGDSRELQQLWVERGAHMSLSSAEEITMLTSLLQKVATGRWPASTPGRLNASASRLGADYQKVLDLVSGVDLPQPPAFTRFRPARPQRPTR